MLFENVMLRAALFGLLALWLAVSVPAHAVEPTTYLIVLEGSDTPDGFAVGGDNLLNLPAALSAIAGAGGVVTADLGEKIGVVIVTTVNPLFADVLRGNSLVAVVGEDVPFRASRDPIEDLPLIPPLPAPGEDPLESQQWGMQMIRADQARMQQSGSPAVDVAVLDSGIDAAHLDFFVGAHTNIDTVRARSFVPEEPNPLVETPSATAAFGHGTATAGLIAARKNGLGMVGVAPDVTIVPIRIAEANNLIRPSWAVQGITYAGEIQADVINMSFYTDDEEPGTSTQLKCTSDPAQLAYRRAHERAIRYARKRGALPVTVAGNDGIDLSANAECDQIPAETPGVVTVGGLDIDGVLVGYSQYGLGAIDLVAPAGLFAVSPEEDRSVCSGSLITAPGNRYGCGNGTSFAGPRVSGVAALIISQFGKLGSDGDVKMPVGAVEELLFGAAIDVGSEGEDLCYGLGRVDALRAVQGVTSTLHEASDCLRYGVSPPNSCPGPQITDPVGDAGDGGLPSSGHRADLDFASASFTLLSSGDLQITLAIQDLNVPPPPADPAGEWAVYFDSDDGDADPDNDRFIVAANGIASSGTLRCSAGRFTGSEAGFDTLAPWIESPTDIPCTLTPGPNGTIVFTVPLSAVGNPPHGAQLTNLTAGTYLATAVSRSPRADGALGVDYTVGEVCIPPTP